MEIAPNPKLCHSLTRNRIMSWLMGTIQQQRILLTNSNNRNHKRSATIKIHNSSNPKHLYHHKRTIQPKNLRRKNWEKGRSRFRKLNLGQYSSKIWVRRLKYAMMPLHIQIIGHPFLVIKMKKTNFWVCVMITLTQHQPW